MSVHGNKSGDKITPLKSIAAKILKFLSHRYVAVPLSLAVTAVAMWLAIRGVDLRHAWEIIKTADPWPMSVAFLMIIPGTLLRSWRFQLLMSKPAARDFVPSFEALMVGMFASGVLPMRAGEAARVAYFVRRTRSPLMSTASALVLERIMDLLTMALMAAVFLPLALGAETSRLKVPPWLFAAASTAGILFLASLGIWLFRQGDRDPADYHGMKKRLMEARQGLASLRNAKQASLVSGISVANWMITAVPAIFMFKAMGVDITYAQSVVVFLGVCFGVALPSAPGFVGVFHMGFVAGAMLVGIPKDAALATSVVSHLFAQLPFILIGGLILAYRRMGLPDPEETVEKAVDQLDDGERPSGPSTNMA